MLEVSIDVFRCRTAEVNFPLVNFLRLHFLTRFFFFFLEMLAGRIR